MPAPSKQPGIIIPVIDVLDGVCVHAVAGRREQYQPLRSRLTHGSDPVQIATAMIGPSAATTLYVADLDSLIHATVPSVRLLEQLRGTNCEIWCDAAWHLHRDALAEVAELEQIRPIISLESAPDLAAIERLFSIASASAPIFSLDLREGIPVRPTLELTRRTPMEWVEQIANIGFESLIVLDIVSVGTRTGPQQESLLTELVAKFPHMRLISGGGVNRDEDIENLIAIGCEQVLVATAIHEKLLENR